MFYLHSLQDCVYSLLSVTLWMPLRPGRASSGEVPALGHIGLTTELNPWLSSWKLSPFTHWFTLNTHLFNVKLYFPWRRWKTMTSGVESHALIWAFTKHLSSPFFRMVKGSEVIILFCFFPLCAISCVWSKLEFLLPKMQPEMLA